MINTLCNLCSMYDWSGKEDYGKQGKERKELYLSKEEEEEEEEL